MKRVAYVLAVVMLWSVGTGCVAVSAKHNRFGSDLDAVAMDGNIYLVNKKSGKFAKVDSSQLCSMGDLIKHDRDCDCWDDCD